LPCTKVTARRGTSPHSRSTGPVQFIAAVLLRSSLCSLNCF